MGNSAPTPAPFPSTAGGLYFVTWRKVATFCDMPELYCLGLCSRTLNEVCDHPPLWTALLESVQNTRQNNNGVESDEVDEQTDFDDCIGELDLEKQLNELLTDETSPFATFLKRFFHLSQNTIPRIIRLQIEGDMRLASHAGVWQDFLRRIHREKKKRGVRTLIGLFGRGYKFDEHYVEGNKLLLTSSVRKTSPTLILLNKIRVQDQRTIELQVLSEDGEAVAKKSDGDDVVVKAFVFLLFTGLGCLFHAQLEYTHLRSTNIMKKEVLTSTCIEASQDGRYIFSVFSHETEWKVMTKLMTSTHSPEYFLLLLPHCMLAFFGGGYSGNFFSGKRVDHESVFNMMFRNSCAWPQSGEIVIRNIAELFLRLGVLFILWCFPLWLMIAVLVLVLSSCYFFGYKTTIKLLFVVICTPLYLQVSRWTSNADAQEKLFNRTKKVLSDFHDQLLLLLNRRKLFVVASAGIIFTILTAVFCSSENVVSVVEWIGVTIFGIPPNVGWYAVGLEFRLLQWVGLADPEVFSDPNNKEGGEQKMLFFYASISTIVIFLFHSVLRPIVAYLTFDNRIDSLLNYHFDHPRFSSSPEKKEKYQRDVARSAFWYHLWWFLLSFVSLRFRWAFVRIAVEQNMFENEYEFGFLMFVRTVIDLGLAKCLILSFGSDYYRLVILKNEFDHEAFRNSRMMTDHPEEFDRVKRLRNDDDEEDDGEDDRQSLSYLMKQISVDF